MSKMDEFDELVERYNSMPKTLSECRIEVSASYPSYMCLFHNGGNLSSPEITSLFCASVNKYKTLIFSDMLEGVKRKVEEARYYAIKESDDFLAKQRGYERC